MFITVILSLYFLFNHAIFFKDVCLKKASLLIHRIKQDNGEYFKFLFSLTIRFQIFSLNNSLLNNSKSTPILCVDIAMATYSSR